MTPCNLRKNWRREHAYYHRDAWIEASNGTFHLTNPPEEQAEEVEVAATCQKFDEGEGIGLCGGKLICIHGLYKEKIEKLKLENEIYKLELAKSKLASAVAKQAMVGVFFFCTS